MVYPTQRFEARKAVLEALKKHTSPETGIGYNKLFDKVKDKIGSKATFSKYLSELQNEMYVTKIPDPKHGRAVVLYRLPEASDYELRTLRLIDKIWKASTEKEVKPILYDEKEFGKIRYESQRNVEIVLNCIFWTQKTLTKMLPKIQAKYGKAPFVRTVEVDGKIQVEFKTAK